MVKKILQLLKRTFTTPEGLSLDSTGPVSRFFGEDRGTPIDRYYIDKFLARQSHLVTGTVMEIADDKYIRKFGRNVSTYEILYVNKDNPRATIVGDLTDSATLPADKIDCFICTQTFNFIFNFSDAIRGAHHVLKPGGYLLATISGPCQVSRYDMDRWGDYWRFTTLSTQKTFDAVFGDGNVEVDYYGNFLSSMSLLRGIAAEEITTEKLDFKDPDYQVTIVVTARKK
ncbi:MAG TPA: methyltransferase domain-containing protein [Chitinophagaceae bacterium]|jgi:SAM-dependent methyltransferase|nr:methyltransferase domain-containing protein [Chitinophagaceae bacterium]